MNEEYSDKSSAFREALRQAMQMSDPIEHMPGAEWVAVRKIHLVRLIQKVNDLQERYEGVDELMMRVREILEDDLLRQHPA